MTLLHKAVQEGALDVVKALLAHGASFTATCNVRRRPRDACAAWLCTVHGGDAVRNGSPPLDDRLRRARSACPCVQLGRTPLECAPSRKVAEVVEGLIKTADARAQALADHPDVSRSDAPAVRFSLSRAVCGAWGLRCLEVEELNQSKGGLWLSGPALAPQGEAQHATASMLEDSTAPSSDASSGAGQKEQGKQGGGENCSSGTRQPAAAPPAARRTDDGVASRDQVRAGSAGPLSPLPHLRLVRAVACESCSSMQAGMGVPLLLGPPVDEVRGGSSLGRPAERAERSDVC